MPAKSNAFALRDSFAHHRRHSDATANRSSDYRNFVRMVIAMAINASWAAART
jgi:hypothetical protein